MTARGIDISGKRLRRLRENKGLSVTALASLAGVSKPHLSQVERGVRRPSPFVLAALCEVLRVGVEDVRED